MAAAISASSLISSSDFSEIFRLVIRLPWVSNNRHRNRPVLEPNGVSEAEALIKLLAVAKIRGIPAENFGEEIRRQILAKKSGEERADRRARPRRPHAPAARLRDPRV